MEKLTSYLLLAVSVFWITIASTSALQCYECNLYLCSRNTTETEQCKLAIKYREAKNDTSRRQLMVQMEEMAGCHEAKKQNCHSCLKVETTNRRQQPGGVYRVDTILSKVCAREKPKYTEAVCKWGGPAHARQHVCHCFSDFCNSASSLRDVISRVTSLTIVLALGQYILHTQ